jgi:hypothetical protein
MSLVDDDFHKQERWRDGLNAIKSGSNPDRQTAPAIG